MNETSIIIPAFNCAGWIGRTVESCLAQTRRAVEVIVIDDGSTDGTGGVCSGFGEAIRYVKVENGGVSRARNIGAGMASGQWFLFLDADDILLPQAVEWLVERAVQAGAGVAYGMVLERRGPPALPRLNGFDFCAGSPPAPSRANVNRCAIITPGSAIVWRETFEQAGGFVSGTEPMEDRDLWLRCGLLAPVVHRDAVVLDKTWRPDSHGTQAAKRIYRGWLAKRRLRLWGAKRNLPVDWIPPDATLLTDAIKEAFHWRCWELLDPLLGDADAAGLTNTWTLRARVARSFLRVAGRLPTNPAWIESSARNPE